MGGGAGTDPGGGISGRIWRWSTEAARGRHGIKRLFGFPGDAGLWSACNGNAEMTHATDIIQQTYYVLVPMVFRKGRLSAMPCQQGAPR